MLENTGLLEPPQYASKGSEALEMELSHISEKLVYEKNLQHFRNAFGFLWENLKRAYANREKLEKDTKNLFNEAKENQKSLVDLNKLSSGYATEIAMLHGQIGETWIVFDNAKLSEDFERNQLAILKEDLDHLTNVVEQDQIVSQKREARRLEQNQQSRQDVLTQIRTVQAEIQHIKGQHQEISQEIRSIGQETGKQTDAVSALKVALIDSNQRLHTEKEGCGHLQTQIDKQETQLQKLDTTAARITRETADLKTEEQEVHQKTLILGVKLEGLQELVDVQDPQKCPVHLELTQKSAEHVNLKGQVQRQCGILLRLRPENQKLLHQNKLNQRTLTFAKVNETKRQHEISRQTRDQTHLLDQIREAEVLRKKAKKVLETEESALQLKAKKLAALQATQVDSHQLPTQIKQEKAKASDMALNLRITLGKYHESVKKLEVETQEEKNLRTQMLRTTESLQKAEMQKVHLTDQVHKTEAQLQEIQRKKGYAIHQEKCQTEKNGLKQNIQNIQANIHQMETQVNADKKLVMDDQKSLAVQKRKQSIGQRPSVCRSRDFYAKVGRCLEQKLKMTAQEVEEVARSITDLNSIIRVTQLEGFKNEERLENINDQKQEINAKISQLTYESQALLSKLRKASGARADGDHWRATQDKVHWDFMCALYRTHESKYIKLRNSISQLENTRIQVKDAEAKYQETQELTFNLLEQLGHTSRIRELDCQLLNFSQIEEETEQVNRRLSQKIQTSEELKILIQSRQAQTLEVEKFKDGKAMEGFASVYSQIMLKLRGLVRQEKANLAELHMLETDYSQKVKEKEMAVSTHDEARQTLYNEKRERNLTTGFRTLTTD